MFNMLNIHNIYDIFFSEAKMKDPISGKGNKIESEIADSETNTDCIEEQANPFGDLSNGTLKKMIHKNRKFFRVSAELSVNSN